MQIMPDGRQCGSDSPICAPIQGPAFLWARGFSLVNGEYKDTEVATDVLVIYAVEFYFGAFTKFVDDTYWRSDYSWGGPGTKWYVRHFDHNWCWIRSDGVMLETSPRPHWKLSIEKVAIQEGLKLLLDATSDAEPIDPRKPG